jgi:penicillin-binding protein 2
MVKPRLVRSIDGKDVPVPEPESLGLDGSMLRAVQAGMFEVMNGAHGTARSARIADETMLMAGKTGTAQVRNISTAERDSGVVANDALPWKQRDHALFVGFAPADAPRYAVSVVVEHGGGGSAVAAPIARDAILRALSDGMPALTSYPADQRGRIETMLKNLKLRLPDGTAPESSKA